MAANLLMGVDLGTSSTKTVLVNPEGRLLSVTAEEYSFGHSTAGLGRAGP